jgi:hypothetical protein
MSDGLKVEVDSADLLSAMRQFGEQAKEKLKWAARVSAYAIRDEQRRRVAHRTGETARNIEVREDYNGTGYIVLTNDVLTNDEKAHREKTWSGKPSRRSKANYKQMKHVGIWLEHGTRNKDGTVRQQAKPFFWEAARLEESAFERRMRAALAEAAEVTGLGR